MPTKRRKDGARSRHPKRRQVPPPKNDSDSDNDDTTTIVVEDLYQQAVALADREERQRALHRAVEETGALRRVVWPSLWRRVQQTNHHSQKTQTSLLVAALVSWEHREGVNPDTALEFVSAAEERHLEACREICRDIFVVDANETDYDRLATASHFMTVLVAGAQQKRQQTLATLLQESLEAVVHWMPERARELWLRQQQQQQTLDKLNKKPDEPPFVVTIVQQMLHLVEGDRLKLGHISLNEATTDNDDDTDEGDEKKSRLSEWKFLHRALELLLDLVTFTATITSCCLAPYLQAMHLTVRCRLAIGTAAASRAAPNMLLTQQLLERLSRQLQQVLMATTSTTTGGAPAANSHVQIRSLYHARASILQKMCHRHYAQELPDVIYSGVGLLCQASFLREALGGLEDHKLLELLHRMRLVNQNNNNNADSRGENQLLYNREFLLQVLEDFLVLPRDPLEELQHFPLYPTEQVLWDFTRIPPSHSSLLPESHVLSLPKLSTRFLSFGDYLWRNFELMRLESAYEIRSDLVDVLRRVRPVVRQSQQQDFSNEQEEFVLQTEFSGWARMALELDGHLSITKVEKPSLGSLYPARVLAQITVDLAPCGTSIRREWDGLGEFDNLFLIGVDARKMSGRPAPLMRDFHRSHGQRAWDTDQDRRVPDEDDRSFPSRFGVTLVRGCMILLVKDESGTILSDPANNTAPTGTKRTFLVALDPTQYAMDAQSSAGTDMYQSINLIVRRHGRENSFKAILETIRGLMAGTGSINRVIPPFLQQVILGQGSPDLASYKSEVVRAYSRRTAGVAKPDSFLDYGDTFIDEEHLEESFPGAQIDSNSKGDKEQSESAGRKNYRLRINDLDGATTVEAESYPFLNTSSGNQVKFTPLQVEAIRSGLSPGLSLIQGPPGTGKTDVAVQIIASLYHSFPTQRTIVITHSNAALNDIFEKVVARGDIDEKTLLRLGAGERDLQVESSHDFTKTGRVAYCFQQRGLHLEQVQQLSESLGLSGKAERGADGSPSYTCETADYFRQQHVKKRIRGFERWARDNSISASDEVVPESFPFASYFKVTDKISLAQVQTYFAKLDDLFETLAVYRPFERLRSQRQRTDYLLMKQTRVVAMTCTHAAIARSHLVELGFEYDNLVVEEAGQMVEIEGFIPLLLQKGDAEGVSSASSRLKRVCLMGDHNQLPPVIKNMSFSKFSSLDQSMFTRLIRLGVPYTQLDKQGRARPEIASLYSWRYQNLGNLDHVTSSDKFQLANPGFVNTMQLVNVEDFEGKGETSPTAYFYQNFGEAEYAVALFQYMVLIGHSPRTISILTTYNGQKQLIEDIMSQRCGEGTPLAGIRPRSISTVDQYQGQQNDYILLSLVRSQFVGHLRDVRRLVVAVSRARLGLYVFCRHSLFGAVHDLKQTFDQFAEKPTKLQLVLGENYPSERKVSDEIPKDNILELDDVSHMGSIVHQMQQDLVNQMEATSDLQ